AIFYLRFHHRRGPIETAYVGSRQLTLWSSSAAVKEEVATVNYGDRLEVLERSGDQAQVRTASEASGQTRVISNLHLDPARDSPRVRQLTKGVPLEMFERRPVAVPQPASAAP